MPSSTSDLIDPRLTRVSEQTGLSATGPVEGEAVIDLTLAADIEYDVDDLGDGRLVIQYWGAAATESDD